MLTIGLSGASCSGKTSVASLLEKVLPRCSVLNQDKYYYQEDSGKHVRDNKSNFINWEVPQAFNMFQMYSDIKDLQIKPQLIRMNENLAEAEKVLKGNQSLLHLARKTPAPILIIEGITIFGSQRISDLCDMKYFIEIDKESCKSRRKERVWDPEESSWTEDPEYFEMVAWPEYLNSVAKVKESMGEVKMLDSTLDNVDDNFKLVLREILDKTDQRH